MKNKNIISKIFENLLAGTLIDAIKFKYSQFKWKKIIHGKKFIKHLIDDDININLYDDSELSRIIYDGNFEEEELVFFSSFLKPGFVVLDVGANIGLHTLYAAKLVGEQGKVFSFEPVSKTFAKLEENISLNRFKNIKPFNMALSDKSNVTEMMTSQDGFDAWNSMAGQSTVRGENFLTEKITAIKLDDFLEKESSKKIDFIKIDTEGWELQVLQGGKEYLKANNPVLMVEYAEDICEIFGVEVKDVYDFLDEMGYFLFKFNHLDKSLRRVNREERFGVANLIATKDRNFKL